MSTQSLVENTINPRTSPVSWLKRHPLTTLFVLAFSLTWSSMVPQVAAHLGWMPNIITMPYAILVGTLGTLWAALITTGLTDGWAGVRDLVARFFRWRVGLGWYAVALLGPAAYMLAGVGLHAILTGETPKLPIYALPLGQAGLMFLQTLALGMLLNTEEWTWRGVALPLLQNRHGALIGTFLLALVEGAIHLPLFLVPESFFAQVGLGWWMAWNVALTFVATWVYNRTRGSLLITTLLHAAGNAWSSLLPPTDLHAYPLMVGVLWLVVLLIILVSGKQLGQRQSV